MKPKAPEHAAARSRFSGRSREGPLLHPPLPAPAAGITFGLTATLLQLDNRAVLTRGRPFCTAGVVVAGEEQPRRSSQPPLRDQTAPFLCVHAVNRLEEALALARGRDDMAQPLHPHLHTFTQSKHSTRPMEVLVRARR